MTSPRNGDGVCDNVLEPLKRKRLHFPLATEANLYNLREFPDSKS